MPLNLILDEWIPVIGTDGAARTIAPWQMADASVLRVDWPRADLNIACLELLIGLVFMADPPADADEWKGRQPADPDRLRAALAPFAPAFNLTGEGPRFLQDLAPLEGAPNPPDMLFIDSAGDSTAKKNADLMVKRSRYPALPPALAAMALYAFQAFAPSGGAGNRTSMRGGGPMVTLVDPGPGLWPLIWANVPYGAPASLQDLPWMRATVTSEKGQQVFPEQAHRVEAFFGMPRRLRLVAEGDAITGVVQRPYGTNYAGWDHPLTPYYRLRLDTEWLPLHPRAGLFGYRNWLGVVLGQMKESDALRRRADMVRQWSARRYGQDTHLIVAGWAMDNMKPRDFVLSVPVLPQLPEDALICARGMIEAAELIALALRQSLIPVLAEGEAREAVREAFFADTQAAFEERLALLSAAKPPPEVARAWVADMAAVALRLFEGRALPGLGDRDVKDQQAITASHRALSANLRGQGSYGVKAFEKMELQPVLKAARTKEDA